jgi:hypothetical protein
VGVVVVIESEAAEAGTEMMDKLLERGILVCEQL